MVKVERTPAPTASLAIEKQNASGSYTNPNVIEQLSQDFHNKCYLCEVVPPHGIEVEHLRPHGGNKDLSITMNSLYKQLDDYQKTASNKSLRALRGMLSRTYKFAGFTRAYVWAHLETYPDLAESVQLQN
ncbi:MAG: hypothetical protein K2N78_09445 [Oscillospiraceae bacterium]|nr:hypothetical protein [Oscillospiraceae bacterium]